MERDSHSEESAGGPWLNSNGQVLLEDGEPLRQVFGTGLASGYLSSSYLGGEPAFAGQTNGIWLYQQPVADLLLKGIREVLDG